VNAPDHAPALDRALDLAGVVVLVTGGTRGLGRGIATRFLDAGADVVVCGRKEPEHAIASSGGGIAHFVAADVRDADSVAALVGDTIDRFGHLDVLVNNAGGSPPADTTSASARFTNAIIGLNLVAPLLCSQAAFAVMREQAAGGSIVNIASVSGIRPSPNSAAYGAAKAGLINLTETLAVEFAPKVRVNCITVGYVITEQSHLFYGDDDGIAAVGRTVPLGHMADPIEIADVVLFCASPLARYVSGANIIVHGGGELPAYLSAANATDATS
jgi:NAD(P)-dependent dehydrogenase (short-subunit alcohol dehydrogenase family)